LIQRGMLCGVHPRERVDSSSRSSPAPTEKGEGRHDWGSSRRRCLNVLYRARIGRTLGVGIALGGSAHNAIVNAGEPSRALTSDRSTFLALLFKAGAWADAFAGRP